MPLSLPDENSRKKQVAIFPDLWSPLATSASAAASGVTAFAIEGDLDDSAIKSNTFEIEWPPKSGKMQSFPEIDRAAWFDLPVAHVKILESQRLLLDRLVNLVPSSAP